LTGRTTRVAAGSKLASAKCKSCGARILWTTTAKGAAMPVDFEPVEKGNVALEPTADGWASRHVSADELAANAFEASNADERLVVRLSHFVTCPNAATHRKAR
jgi:hypothetical protein